MELCVYVLFERTASDATIWKYKTEEISNFPQFLVHVLGERTPFNATTWKYKRPQNFSNIVSSKYVTRLLIILGHDFIKQRRAQFSWNNKYMSSVKGLLIMLQPESIDLRRTQIFCNFVYVLCESTPFHATTWKYEMEEYSNFLQLCMYNVKELLMM